MNFENMVCPVCGRAFAEGEDIVVCPDCGTPHHRACWAQEGHCANRIKHGEFVFGAGGAEQKKERRPEDHEPDHAEKAEAPTIVCPTCGAKNPKVNLRCFSCGELLREESDRGFSPFRGMFEGAEAETNAREKPGRDVLGFARWKERFGDEALGGMRADEAAFCARQNPEYYVERFRRFRDGAKVSWNWASALFGPMWFFYRRMLTAGFVVMLIHMFIGYFSSIVSELLFKAFRPEVYEAYMAMAQRLNAAIASGAPDVNALSALARSILASPVFLANIVISAAASLIAMIATGAFGNYLYYNHTRKTVKLAHDLSDAEGERSMIMNARGGVSVRNVVVPILAYFAVSILTSLIGI